MGGAGWKAAELWPDVTPVRLQVTFLILDGFPPANKTWLEESRGSWMAEPEKWHREMYQRDIAAPKIQVLFQGCTAHACSSFSLLENAARFTQC